MKFDQTKRSKCIEIKNEEMYKLTVGRKKFTQTKNDCKFDHFFKTGF